MFVTFCMYNMPSGVGALRSSLQYCTLGALSFDTTSSLKWQQNDISLHLHNNEECGMHEALQHTQTQPRALSCSSYYGTVHVCCVCMHVPRSRFPGSGMQTVKT